MVAQCDRRIVYFVSNGYKKVNNPMISVFSSLGKSSPAATSLRYLSFSASHILGATRLAWLLIVLSLGSFSPNANAIELVNDGVVSGSISVPGESDEFTFDASAGEVLHIRVTDPNSRAFAPKVWLYNPDDSLNQVSSDNVTVAFDCNVSPGNCQLNQTGTYRLVVADDGDNNTGSYEIRLARVLSTNENGALVNDGVVVGDITVGDIDTFVFEASAGEVLHIRVTDAGNSSFLPRVWLYNPDGSLNQESSNSTTVAFDCFATSSSCELNQTGTYRLVVADDGDNNTGSYEIRLARVLQSNENGALVNDGVVIGDITVGDIDTFVFDASAGEVLHIRVTDPNSRAFAPKVWLYNPDGSLNQVSSGNVTVAFDCNVSPGNCQLNQTGTYRLVVEDNSHTSTGSYEIRLARVLSTNENGALVNDGVVVGDITVGDIDTFVFEASAGEVLHIRVTDAGNSSFLPRVWLYNPDGSLNQESSNSTTVAFDCFATSSSCELNQTGTYRLVVADDGDNNTGSYEIRLARVLQSNENGALVNDGVVIGDITVGDIDTFVFDASAGEVLHIRVTDPNSRAFAPKVWLYNPDGSLNQVSSGNVTVAFDCNVSPGNCQLNQTGTYRLVVEDNSHTWTGGYEISFDGPPQFTLTNDQPYWDARFPAGPAVQLRWTLSSHATDYEVYRDGIKIYPTSGVLTERSFRNELGLSPGQTYSYYILANNSTGSNKTNTITVGPMPNAPAAPLLDNTTPIVIVQGNSYEDVTLTGSGFTDSSWHQFSVDNGVTWYSAQSAPVFNSDTSMMVGVNNTNVGSVLVRVCTSYGSGVCSNSTPVNIQAVGSVISPRVDKVFPTALAQGGGSQDITLYGAGFAAQNRYQQSINGADWVWATYAPVVNSSSKLTVTADTSSLGTVRIRVCAYQDSTSCSGSVLLSVYSTPSTTPSLSSLPTELTQFGTDHFTVTLMGANFTKTSFPQISYDDGASWYWVEYEPSLKASDTLTTRVSNVSAPTIKFRVCSYYGSSDCSDPLPFINQGALQPTEFDFTCNQSGCSTGATKAVIVTHGWNSNGNAWARDMAYHICEQTGLHVYPAVQPAYHTWQGCTSPSATNYCDVLQNVPTKVCTVGNSGNLWDVYVLDWRTDSGESGVGIPYLKPKDAWDNAEIIGGQLGMNLAAENYSQYHFIAHSAGSGLIDAAGTKLKDKKGSAVAIHETYLDAYDPREYLQIDAISESRHISKYGESAKWVDNYVDTRPLDAVIGGKVFNIETTDMHLDKGYNIDVTPINGNDCSNVSGVFNSNFVCPHGRPYRFYLKSIDNNISGDFDEDGHDPISKVGNMEGFPRSDEGGNNVDSLETNKDGECRMQDDGTCATVPWETTVWEYLGDTVVSAGKTAVSTVVSSVKNATGLTTLETASTWIKRVSLSTSTIIGGSSQMAGMTITAANSTTSSDEPAYLTLEVNLDGPVNVLMFNWGFDTSGEGLLQVFLDGELIRTIDQRYELPASTEPEEIYVGGDTGYLAPGSHELAFRLDGYGENESNIEITDVSFDFLQAINPNGIYVIPFSGNNGTISPYNPQAVASGGMGTLTVTPDTGYAVNSSVDGTCPQGSWSGNVWTTGAVDQTCSVSFIFEALDTDADEIPDYEDQDDDNDGISDLDETGIYGTDPLLYDTDGDSFSDNEEILAGSDPLDNSSIPVNVPDGDINDDGQVDVSDLLLAMRILTGQNIPTQQEQDRWDVAPLVNGVPLPDQQNNLGDYLVLQRKVLGIINF